MKYLLPIAAILLSACSPSPDTADDQSYTEKTKDAPMPNIIVKSANNFATTETKLRLAIEEKGLKLFTVVDHGAGAKSVDADIGESKLFIFGNPKAGTPLMTDDVQMGLELPLKILITSGMNKETQIIYKDIAESAQNYNINGKDQLLGKISENLNALATAAAAQ